MHVRTRGAAEDGQEDRSTSQNGGSSGDRSHMDLCINSFVSLFVYNCDLNNNPHLIIYQCRNVGNSKCFFFYLLFCTHVNNTHPFKNGSHYRLGMRYHFTSENSSGGNNCMIWRCFYRRKTFQCYYLDWCW